MKIHNPEMSNIGHRICIKVDNKYFHLRAIVQTDAEANAFMSTHPSTALIDEDQHGNKYIAEVDEIG